MASQSLFLSMAECFSNHCWARISLGTNQQDSAFGTVHFCVPSERAMLIKEREMSL